MEIYENMNKMSEGGIHETQWQNFILILSE